MKVILQKDVINLGDAGDVREVPDGYARNFLIPRKLVIPARGNSVRAAEHQKKLMSLKIERRNKEMEGLAEKINALDELEIQVRVGAKSKIFGSVTSVHIAQALQNAGFSIDKRKIDSGDAIRALGKFPVKIRLAEKIMATVNVNVVPDKNFPVEEEEIPEPAAPVEENQENQEEPSASSEAEEEASDTSQSGE